MMAQGAMAAKLRHLLRKKQNTLAVWLLMISVCTAILAAIFFDTPSYRLVISQFLIILVLLSSFFCALPITLAITALSFGITLWLLISPSAIIATPALLHFIFMWVTLGLALLSAYHRKNTETRDQDALRKIEHRSNEIGDHVQDMIMQINAQSIVTYINPAFERILGYAPTDFVGKPFGILNNHLHPSETPFVPVLSHQSRAEVSPRKLEFRVVHAEGHYLWLESLSVPIFGADGACLGRVITARDITERKQSEEQLQYQANLLEHVSDAIIATDMNREIRSWNRAAELLYNVPAAQVIGKPIMQVLKIEYEEGWTEETVLKAVSRQGLWKGTAVHERQDGNRISVSVSFALLKDRQGNIIGRVGVNQDITEHKKAEKALGESQHFIRRVTDASPNVLYVYDLIEQRIVYDSAQSVNSIGRTPDELMELGSSLVKTVIHPDDMPQLLAALEQVKIAQDGDIVETEMRVRHSNGEWRWVYGRMVVFLRGPDGVVRQMLGVGMDVTQRKHAEEALRQSERDYRGLFEQAHDAILVLDPNSEIILDCNQRACELYGFTRSEFVGMSIEKISKDARHGKAQIQKTLDAGTKYQFETAHYRKDGSEIPLEINGAKVEYQGQTAILSINRDISLRKHLHHAERLAAIGKLSASIAHEVNNPLQAIQGALALVNEDPRLDHHLRVYIDIAQTEILRIIHVINQMREVYRPTQETYSTFLLNTEIERLLPLMRKRLEEQSVCLTLRLATNLPPIYGISDQIRQVFLNLMLNALDAMPDGGNLEISTDVDSQFVVAEVCDSGYGIPDEDISQIFAPFFTKKVHGTGLGLSISNDIVNQHSGKLTVTSQVGKGTSCRIVLPILART